MSLKGWCRVALRWKPHACCCPGRAVSLCRRLYGQHDPLAFGQAFAVESQQLDHSPRQHAVDDADAAMPVAPCLQVTLQLLRGPLLPVTRA